MKRVTGLGGVFFKARDPKRMMEWYARHLGINMDPEYGTSFEWRTAADPSKKGFTAWSPFKEDTTYFEPSKKEFMMNYRVADLDGLLRALAEESVEIIGEVQVFDYGKFAHIVDPEGNKIELWEPNDEEYDKMTEGLTTR